ncbi:hypothetical protein D3C76_478170 [compost metagenome]
MQTPSTRLGIGAGGGHGKLAGFGLETGEVRILIVAKGLLGDELAAGPQVGKRRAQPGLVVGAMAGRVEVLLQ